MNKLFNDKKVFFIADIAANHDGSLSRAKKIIKLAAKAGADAVKFQHFKANTIVSDAGFKKIGKISHQKKWRKSVFQIYEDASINPKWNLELLKECKKNKIEFMTAPYDLDYVDDVYKFISAYKIGSGDITWKEIIKKISKKNKPLILATGASTIKDVVNTVRLILKYKTKFVLMQCNTNYTASNENYEYINLNVLNDYKKRFKDKIVLGLSDHTFGHTTVLGAVSLGARVVEKHFTDDNTRNGPDHKFSMNPIAWREMVDETEKLIQSLGNGKKKIEKNELQSSIIQRRGVRFNQDLSKGRKITRKMLEILRPCPRNSINPFFLEKFLGKKLKKNVKKNDIFTIKCVI